MICITLPNDIAPAKKAAKEWLKSFPAIFHLPPMSRNKKLHMVLANEASQLPTLPPDASARFADGSVKYGAIRKSTMA